MRKLEEMTDEQLALAYVEGDNRAFDLLLSRNEVKLFGYIMFVVHDQERRMMSFRRHSSRWLPNCSSASMCPMASS